MLDVVGTTVLLDNSVLAVNAASIVDVVDDSSTVVDDTAVEDEIPLVLVVLP